MRHPLLQHGKQCVLFGKVRKHGLLKNGKMQILQKSYSSRRKFLFFCLQNCVQKRKDTVQKLQRIFCKQTKK